MESFEVSDSEYADDTAVLFPSRAELEKWAPVLIQTFADFGMEVHVKKPGDRKEKRLCPAPKDQNSSHIRRSKFKGHRHIHGAQAAAVAGPCTPDGLGSCAKEAAVFLVLASSPDWPPVFKVGRVD